MRLGLASALNALNAEDDNVSGSLFPEAEKDLPDLLRDLHEENSNDARTRESSSVSQSGGADEGSGQNDNAAKDEQPAEPEAGKDIPEWLKKVRQRVGDEGDAYGDLVKKVSARDSSLEEDVDKELRRQFDDWIGRLRSDAQQEAARDGFEPLDEEGLQGEVPAWLRYLRESKGVSPNLAEGMDRSAPNAGEKLPDWLGDTGEESQAATGKLKAEGTSGENEATQQIRLRGSEELQEHQPLAEQEYKTDLVTEPEDLGAQAADISLGLDDVTRQMQVSHASLGGATSGLSSQAVEEGFWEERTEHPMLRVARSQRSRAELLKALVAAEGKPAEKQAAQRRRKTWLFRLLLALLLLTAVIFPFLSTSNQTPQTGTLPVEAQALMDSINALESGSPVLIVTDYQAGFSAEMEQVADPLIRHLAQKQVQMVLLSTYPEGVWLAERLLDVSLTDDSFSQVREQAVNLGFLPGGRIGLLSYAVDAQASFAEGVWESSNLGNINHINDFSMVLILADTLDSARSWLEQAGPSLIDTPMFMVSSTQEAAMMLPYLDSGQLAGMLSGVQDAGLYETALGDTVMTSTIWSAYQAGLLAMATLILVGFVIGLESNARTKQEEEQKK